MILRRFAATAGSPTALAGFACSSGLLFEDDVERWVRHRALRWLNDVPKAAFQRRQLARIEDGTALVAVVAWQDIVLVDLEGIWLEVIAVGSTYQHGGHGQDAYDLVVDELQRVDRDGDHLAGVLHIDNQRSKRLLERNGWQHTAAWDADHELWVGRL